MGAFEVRRADARSSAPTAPELVLRCAQHDGSASGLDRQRRRRMGRGGTSPIRPASTRTRLPTRPWSWRARIPEGLFTNVVIWNELGQTADYLDRTVSLNDAQMELGEDRRYRVVIAHRDPGVPNWAGTPAVSHGPRCSGGSCFPPNPLMPPVVHGNAGRSGGRHAVAGRYDWGHDQPRYVRAGQPRARRLRDLQTGF